MSEEPREDAPDPSSGPPEDPQTAEAGTERGPEPGAAQAAASPGSPGGAVIAFVEPDPAERERLATLAGELGHEVWAVDPFDADPAIVEALADAVAVVVAWNAGGRPGLDLVETLSHDERTRHVPVALAADSPTRAQVAAALRAGARAMVIRPYDPQEIRSRLLPDAAAGPEAAEGDGAAAG